MEVVRFEIKRIRVSKKARESIGYLTAVALADSDVDRRLACLLVHVFLRRNSNGSTVIFGVAFSHFPPRIGMAMRITPIAPATSDPIQTSDTRVRAAMAPSAMAI